MFTRFYDSLYERLCAALLEITAAGHSPVKRFAAAMHAFDEVWTLLREKVLSIPFPSSEIEILFFKTVKPRFAALRILHFGLYGLDVGRPFGTTDMLIARYRSEILVISRFFEVHAGAYDYYRSERCDLDQVWFVRGAEVPAALAVEMPETDPLFSTAMDYLFAKFIGYEGLQKEIIYRIGLLDGSVVASSEPAPTGLKWTGKVVDLAELIYGLHDTGMINHGDASFSQIVPVFERMFGVKIRDVHHTFGEVMERKVASPCRFIDRLAAAIKLRVDEGLKYKPRK